MKILTLIALLYYTQRCYGKTPHDLSRKLYSSSQSLIVGGRAFRIRDFPFMGLLRISYPARHEFCGSTILKADIVLTTAFCLGSLLIDIRISVGSAFPDKHGTNYYSTEYIAHPLFKHVATSTNHDYDIAVVITNLNIYIDYVVTRAVHLTHKGTILSPGTNVTIVGWGATFMKGPERSEVLRATDVPVVSNTSCHETLKKRVKITPRMFCAGKRELGAHNFCHGDIGGPALINKHEQVGIMSGSIYCGFDGDPAWFTDVATFRGWLTRVAHV